MVRLVCNNALVGISYQSNINMDDRTQRFPAKHFTKHNTGLPSSHSASYCQVFAQVSESHTPGQPHEVKENMICPMRPRSSIASWFSSNAYVRIPATFGGGQESARTP